MCQMKSMLRMCEKQTYVKPNGDPGPKHMCCNICLYAFAGTHAIAPVISSADIDSPSFCNPNSPPLGVNISIFQFSEQRPRPSSSLINSCLPLAEVLSQILHHPTAPQIIYTIVRITCVETLKALHILSPLSVLESIGS